MKFSRSAVFVLALAMTLPQGASGQSAQRPVLSFGTELTMVAVPVFVTDKDGKTVPGLTAADFQLQDAGKRERVRLPNSRKIPGAASFARPTTLKRV